MSLASKTYYIIKTVKPHCRILVEYCQTVNQCKILSPMATLKHCNKHSTTGVLISSTQQTSLITNYLNSGQSDNFLTFHFHIFTMKNPVTSSSPRALNVHDSKIFPILISSL